MISQISEDFIKDVIRTQFKKSEPRANQLDIIYQIVVGFLFEQKQHVVLDAPTGSGKTVIGYTVHEVLKYLFESDSAEHVRSEFESLLTPKARKKLHSIAISKNGGKKSFFKTTITTSTNMLQDQFVLDFPEVANLYGKSKYACNVQENRKFKIEGENKIIYGTPECLIQKSLSANLPNCAKCNLQRARKEFMESTVSVTSLSFLLSYPLEIIPNLARDEANTSDSSSVEKLITARFPSLLVLDECSNVGSSIRNKGASINLKSLLHPPAGILDTSDSQKMADRCDYLNKAAVEAVEEIVKFFGTGINDSILDVKEADVLRAADVINKLHFFHSNAIAWLQEESKKAARNFIKAYNTWEDDYKYDCLDDDECKVENIKVISSLTAFSEFLQSKNGSLKQMQGSVYPSLRRYFENKWYVNHFTDVIENICMSFSVIINSEGSSVYCSTLHTKDFSQFEEKKEAAKEVKNILKKALFDAITADSDEMDAKEIELEALGILQKMDLDEEKMLREPVVLYLAADKLEDILDIISGFSIRPINPSKLAQETIFARKEFDFFLHMSATVCGFEQYVNELGIDIESAKFIEMQNYIPLENRVVNILNVDKVSNNELSTRFISIFDSILDHHFSEGHKGIVHSASFKRAYELKEKSKHGHLFAIPNSGARDAKELFSNYSVLVSPSIMEGIEFPHNESRFQIFVKVPYANYGDHYVRKLSELESSLYFRDAILNIIQGCGRSIRAPNDWAETYILDTAINGLLQHNRHIFPKWFLESLKS